MIVKVIVDNSGGRRRRPNRSSGRSSGEPTSTRPSISLYAATQDAKRKDLTLDTENRCSHKMRLSSTDDF